MDNYETKEFLEHYGILGMKWGVRKPETIDRYNRMRRAGKKPPKGGSKKARKIAAAEAVNMTDDELRDRVNRIRMEQQYVDLAAGTTNKGKNFIEKALRESGEQAAKGYLKKAMEMGATALATKWVLAAREAAKAGEKAAPLLIEMKHGGINVNGYYSGIPTDDIDEFLAHYGIMGMKWGVRKPETLARYARGKHKVKAKVSKKLNSMRESNKARKISTQNYKELEADRKWLRKSKRVKTVANEVMNSDRVKKEVDARLAEISKSGKKLTMEDAAIVYENTVNDILRKDSRAQTPSGKRYMGIRVQMVGQGELSINYGSFPHSLNKNEKITADAKKRPKSNVQKTKKPRIDKNIERPRAKDVKKEPVGLAATVEDMKKNGINSEFMKREYPTEKMALDLMGMTRKQILEHEIKEMDAMVKRGY